MVVLNWIQMKFKGGLMKVIYIGGGKGGVGKSVMSAIALHSEIEAGSNPILVETDTANPDVFKAYKDSCEAYCFDIDDPDGWASTLNTIEAAGDRPVIINSGARNQKTIENYGDVLNELDDVTTLWVVNSELDGLILLTNYLKKINQKVCVVKNLHNTKPEHFTDFDKSKLKQNGISSVFMPGAIPAISKALKSERCPISKLNEKLSFGDRLLAKKWITNAPLCYQEAMEIAQKYDIK